jgi:RND family efflux transporter MFP subunit
MYKIIAIAFLLGLLACSSKSGQESSSRQHEDEVFRYTLFSDQFEFFIEHPPLEAGVETEFLVHLTDLENYRPCSTGRVTVQIDGVSHTSDEPSSPGIFRIPFTPGREGEFHGVFSYLRNNETQEVEEHLHVYPDHDAIHAAENESGEHSHGETSVGEIEFLKEQAWKALFMVEKIRPGPFRAVIPTSGEILAVPGEKQNITAGSRGIVRFADPYLVQGSAVRKGQVLFILSSETLLQDDVRLRYEEAGNRLEKSRSEFQRHRILYAREAISERQFVNTRTAYVEDSLRFFSLAANITEAGVQVVAPLTGTIHELAVSDGEYTESGSLLATLSSNRNLLLRADLPQQYYKRLKHIRSAHFRPAYTDRVFRVEDFQGTLLASGVSVAENNHFLPVTFRLGNDGQLMEGAFAEIFLQVEEKSNILALPVTALAEEQGRYYVYVQVTGESYTKRRVSIGDSDGRRVEITAGLEPGERVVTTGNMLIKAASMATGDLDHGHSH